MEETACWVSKHWNVVGNSQACKHEMCRAAVKLTDVGRHEREQPSRSHIHRSNKPTSVSVIQHRTHKHTIYWVKYTIYMLSWLIKASVLLHTSHITIPVTHSRSFRSANNQKIALYVTQQQLTLNINIDYYLQINILSKLSIWYKIKYFFLFLLQEETFFFFLQWH